MPGRAGAGSRRGPLTALMCRPSLDPPNPCRPPPIAALACPLSQPPVPPTTTTQKPSTHAHLGTFTDTTSSAAALAHVSCLPLRPACTSSPCDSSDPNRCAAKDDSSARHGRGRRPCQRGPPIVRPNQRDRRGSYLLRLAGRLWGDLLHFLLTHRPATLRMHAAREGLHSIYTIISDFT